MLRSIILSTALLATPALAGIVPSEAQFADGTSAPARVIVNDAIWRCEGARCVGRNENRPVMISRACKTLARQVGALSALTIGTKALDATELAACNEKARSAQ